MLTCSEDKTIAITDLTISSNSHQAINEVEPLRRICHHESVVTDFYCNAFDELDVIWSTSYDKTYKMSLIDLRS